MTVHSCCQGRMDIATRTQTRRHKVRSGQGHARVGGMVESRPRFSIIVRFSSGRREYNE